MKKQALFTSLICLISIQLSAQSVSSTNSATAKMQLPYIPAGEVSASVDHFNALFLSKQDEPRLKYKLPANRIAAAIDQDAFVFWSHPGWTPRAKNGVAPGESMKVQVPIVVSK